MTWQSVSVWPGVLAVIVLLAAPRATADQACGTNEERSSLVFTGEVAGSRYFSRALTASMRFVLAPVSHGWEIEVRDAEGRNMAALTPPLGLPDTNPRMILGWHFRNADNSGPNRGEVNAPQAWRRFSFGPEAHATFAAAGLDVPQAAVDAASGFGRGELTILDLGLADLVPGNRARAVYLAFSVCLEWPMSAGEPAITSGYPGRVIAAFDACGLPDGLALSDHLFAGVPNPQPSHLEPDLDGDGEGELVAPVVRAGDGKRALAVCWRAAGRSEIVGLEGRIGAHLEPAYFDRMDHWSVHERPWLEQGTGQGAPPRLLGQAILLGMEEKSSVLLYWTPRGFDSYWQGD